MKILREIVVFIILAVITVFLYGLVKGDDHIRNLGLVGIILAWKGLVILGFFYIGYLIVKALTKYTDDK